jgi:glycosyltransferase involved in cell wall biosynthesis
MQLLITHGYMLTGSGSNVYVQNLSRALAEEGHEIHLLCQETNPLDHDFVDVWTTVSKSGIERKGEQRTPYPGRCVLHKPLVGDLLPVYVYDEYPGWRVKTFLDLSEDEFEFYAERNVEAIRTVMADSDIEAVVTNHSVPGPLIARRALEGTGTPLLSIVHGSCLQYVVRKSTRYMSVAREGLEGARKIISPSPHGAGTITEDFPEMEEKTLALSGGVDTDLFTPKALDKKSLAELRGGGGRGPKQTEMLENALSEASDTDELLASLEEISASYEPRAHDTGAGARIESLLEGDAPLVVYVGKLIHSKGVHSLLSAFARVRKETDARLLVIGFGTFREGLEALAAALGNGDERSLELLMGLGKRMEGGPDEPLEHFEFSGGLSREARGMRGSIEFVGPLGHRELAKVLPAADAAVVPSIFPEIFGLVAAEFAASGVVPFVAGHSGLSEAGAIVGKNLPFDVRVGMDGFEENIADALLRHLSLPEEERERYAGIVRRNAVEKLSWDSLARDLAALAR